MLRPDPLARSPSIPKSRTGRWYSRASREAAIPRTPRCQPGSASTRTASRSGVRSALDPRRAPRPRRGARGLPLGVAAPRARARSTAARLGVRLLEERQREHRRVEPAGGVQPRARSGRRRPRRSARSPGGDAGLGEERPRAPGTRGRGERGEPRARRSSGSPRSAARGRRSCRGRPRAGATSRESADPGAARDAERDLHGDPGRRELLVGVGAAGLPRIDDDRARPAAPTARGGGR